MAWYEWYTFLEGHPETMVAFSDIQAFPVLRSHEIIIGSWKLSIFQNEMSILFKMIMIMAHFWCK